MDGCVCGVCGIRDLVAYWEQDLARDGGGERAAKSALSFVL